MIYLISDPLLTEAIVDGVDAGKRVLMRDLVLSVNYETMIFPQGFITDYSSWPAFLLAPSWKKMDIAGVAHDYFFKYATTGKGGRSIGYWEANSLWRQIARAGRTKHTRLSYFGALIGYTGLCAGGWIKWLKYRHQHRKQQ